MHALSHHMGQARGMDSGQGRVEVGRAGKLGDLILSAPLGDYAGHAMMEGWGRGGPSLCQQLTQHTGDCLMMGLGMPGPRGPWYKRQRS
jgi:hypothetical protein